MMQWSSIYNKVFTYRFLLTAHPGQWYVKCEGSQNSIFYFVEYNCFYLSRLQCTVTQLYYYDRHISQSTNKPFAVFCISCGPSSACSVSLKTI